jgi:hypothetical protein
MIRFQEGSYALTILLRIAIAGEFPFKSLHMIGDNKIIAQRTVRKLKEEKYITVNGSSDMKTIRLTKKALDVIKDYNKSYYDYYMIISDNHHFRAGTYKENNLGARQTRRRHRMAEVCCLLDDLGILLWPDEKPKLSLKSKDARITPEEFLFFSSKELKNLSPEEKKKYEWTRIMGALYSPGGVYCVYNIDKTVIKWHQQGEHKARIYVQDITQMNYDYSYGFEPEIVNSIFFGKNDKSILDILNPKYIKEDKDGYELLSFKNAYDNIYYITLDNNGIKQLAIIIEKDWKEKLKKCIIPEDILKNNIKFSTIDCDVIDKENNTFILMFFDGNISRLKRFKEAIYGTNNKFQVLCFPWQEEVVKEYMEDLAIVTVIDYEDFKDDFFNF